ncbi:hypothetical protein I350_00944 [Cryptococcus amylolentus CBS 6273]|uniref:F-box domain-containing protein n=1 Tax=Cryptococcus amylolentus CBS 6273 TaxID=1296118 RepID=A0A1E3KB51_9TREE|nr:hypothetical protein I350_00944 [Cryptococcus amylolentus CBS 6273]
MSALLPLFAQDAYSEVLIGVFDCLALKDVLSLLRVNRYVHAVFKTSSRTQLTHTRRLFSAPVTGNYVVENASGPADQLAALRDRERRLDNLDYSSIINIRKDAGERLIAFEQGLLIFCARRDGVRVPKRDFDELDSGEGEEEDDVTTTKVARNDPSKSEILGHLSEHPVSEHAHETMADADAEDLKRKWRATHKDLAYSQNFSNGSSIKDGWDVYRVPEAASDEDSQARGGTIDQGMWCWRTRVTEDLQTVEMCGHDDLMAVIQRGAYFIDRDDPSKLNLSIRISFFSALPPRGTPTPVTGYFAPIPHPEAALPFIDINFDFAEKDVKTDVTDDVKLEVMFGYYGQMSLLVKYGPKTLFAGVWDWKNGVCLGSIPIEDNQTVASLNASGPFATTGSARHVPGSKHQDVYDLAIRMIPLPQAAIPDGREGFVQLSFDTYLLFPPSLGYPPVKPKPDSNPFAPPYPEQACSWFISDIPQVIPVCIFELPIPDLLPWTLAVWYQTHIFGILNFAYSPEVHNAETIGIFTWMLWERKHMSDLSYMLRQATNLALKSLVGRVIHGNDRRRIDKYGPLIPAPHQASTDVAEGVSWVSTLMVHANRVSEDGTWRNAEGVIIPSQTPSKKPTYIRASSHFAHTDWIYTRGLALPSVDITVPTVSYLDWNGANQMRIDFYETVSAAYGAREVRLVPLIEEDGVEDRVVCLSMSDYNPSTLPAVRLSLRRVLGGRRRNIEAQPWYSLDSTIGVEDRYRLVRECCVDLQLELLHIDSSLEGLEFSLSRIFEGMREEEKALQNESTAKVQRLKERMDKVAAEYQLARNDLDKLRPMAKGDWEEEIEEDLTLSSGLPTAADEKGPVYGFEGESSKGKKGRSMDIAGSEAAPQAAVPPPEENSKGKQGRSTDIVETEAAPQATVPPPPYLTLTLAPPTAPTSSSSALDSSPESPSPHATSSSARAFLPSHSSELPSHLQEYYEQSWTSEGGMFCRKGKQMLLVAPSCDDAFPDVWFDGRTMLLSGFTPYDYHILTF